MLRHSQTFHSDRATVSVNTDWMRTARVKSPDSSADLPRTQHILLPALPHWPAIGLYPDFPDSALMHLLPSHRVHLPDSASPKVRGYSEWSPRSHNPPKAAAVYPVCKAFLPPSSQLLSFDKSIISVVSSRLYETISVFWYYFLQFNSTSITVSTGSGKTGSFPRSAKVISG